MTKLQTQLSNITEIRKVLQELDARYEWGDDEVDVKLIYLPCAKGKCIVSPLFEIIKKSGSSGFSVGNPCQELAG